MKKVLAIVYKEEEKQKRFLILHRKLNWVGWECLKETMEENESEEETVRRGMQEEINVKQFEIVKRKKIYIQLPYESTIERAFLIKIDADQKIDISQNKSKEHDDYKWVSQEEAEKLLTHKNITDVLKEISH